ncbi:toprim domain-containing protein [Desulfosediminicola sp.]|uniref:toprim domain-containing protein n=1 Tax=Desulfosediminicola sp. TaxID=2886825 RepID=UPI003AF22112
MGRYNDSTRAPEIVRGLLQDSRFGFKDKGGYLRNGKCPNCGKKELYVSKSEPWRIACSRENNCGCSWTAKELLPHLFENYLKRFPPTETNPRATADAYLREDRGFLIKKIRGWYDQESHRLKDTGEYVPTIRFHLDPERTRYWERLIGKTKADGQKAHIGGKRKADNSLFKGDAWTPPGQQLEDGDTCFITEGIFHAIALVHAGKKVAAALSSSNFPSNFIEANKEKNITWILALDGDKAGCKYMARHRQKLHNLDQKVEICLLPNTKEDWDDLWQKGALQDPFFEDCLHRGKLFTAASVIEKCFLQYKKAPAQTHHVVEFKEAIYSVLISSKLLEDFDFRDHNEVPSSFQAACSVTPICNVAPTFLYMEKDELLSEQKYVFQINYKNGTPAKIIGLEGTNLSSGEAFHKALLNNTNGGRFTGKAMDFSKLIQKWLDGKMLEVQSIPFIGYDKDAQAYVFHDNAFQNGRKISLNEHGYFELDQKGIKTSLGSALISSDGEFSNDWLPKYIKAFHFQGLAVLAFWLGTLFVQQIRAKHKTFPFLEYTGDPGAGKSTVLEFNWKLAGRDEYEGFDIAKSSPAGRRRAFNQVSNLPIVIIESDRERGEGEKRPQQFDFDECKPFYNGRSTGTLGIANKGNDIDEQLFKGTLLISQNAEVDGSEALLQRIVHCHVDKKHHGEGTKELARWFEKQTAADVGGFLAEALKNEQKILSAYFSAFELLENDFAQAGIRNERIIKNHAQIAACAHALKVLFPNLTQNTLNDFFEYLITRAFAREERIAADHPLVEKFWETFHYINDKSRDGNVLNYSKKDEEIAVNLNQFRAKCIEYGQELIDLTILKRYLVSSKRHKFVEKNRAVHSSVMDKTFKCWIFKKQGK